MTTKPQHRHRLSYTIPNNNNSNNNNNNHYNNTTRLRIPTQAEAQNRPSQPNPLILSTTTNNNTTTHQTVTNHHPTHCLGLNALAIDLTTHIQSKNNSNGILYTAGKDGLIAAWELNLPTKKTQNPFHPFQIDNQNLAQINPSRFRQSIQSHTNWCNDILLCNYNQTLISASSDRTVKAWSPHHPQLSLCPTTIGTHNDYVKSLAHSPFSSWVASAGLDRKILLWDINETRPKKPLLSFPESASSIYSLATTPSGQIIASGSPAQPIGLYDPRLCSQVAKLVGHTDNVRSILLSDDGTRLLSASSDTTVKMWDLRIQRCLHTFSHHSASVWALHSQHPRLQIFHSGDRSGWLCKVDLEGSDDFGEGECVVLSQVGRHNDDDHHHHHHHHLDHSNNILNQGIVKIVALDNTFVWTATGSSTVQRWRDVPTRLERRQATISLESSDLQSDHPPPSSISNWTSDTYHTSISNSTSDPPDHQKRFSPSPSLRSPQSVSFNLNPTSSFIPLLPSPPPTRDSRQSPSASIIQSTTHHHLPSTSTSPSPQFIYIPPNKLDDVALESLVPLFSPFDNLLHTSDRPEPTESITIHSSLDSFTSDLNSPSETLNNLTQLSIAPSTLRIQDLESNHNISPPTLETQLTPTVSRPSITQTHAWRLYTARDSAAEAIPLRDAPDEIIAGRSGLVKSEMLNDRRHVITLDTSGTLALWDIISCTCVGIFDDLDDSEFEVDQDSSTGSTGPPCSIAPHELLKLVKGRIEGEASIGTWCSVETQTGLLTVHLDEHKCFDAEVYADESGLSPEVMSLMKEDHRLSLGKWILRNLFDGFINRQAQLLTQKDETPSKPSQARPVMGSEDQESSANNVEAPHPTNSIAKTFIPRTPGMGISLATPALTLAIPHEPKHIHGLNGALKNAQGSDSVSHSTDYFSLSRVVEADEDKLNPGTAMNGPLDSGTDASSSYSSSLNPPSSPRRASPAPISTDGHSRVEDRTQQSENTATINTPSSSVSQPNSASIFTRFKSLGRGQKRRGSQDPCAPTVISNPIPFRDFVNDSTRAELDAQQEALLEKKKAEQEKIVQEILSRPFEPTGEVDAPKIASLPAETMILISEEQAESGAWEVCYRGLVATTYDDAELLLDRSPGWLLDFLLGNRISPAHATAGLVKVTFVLQPEGGPEAAGLPVLGNGNARLTASRALRMKKVASYVAQKLESSSATKSPQQTPKSKPHSHQLLKGTNAETSNHHHRPKSKSIGSSVSTHSSSTASHPTHYHDSSGGSSVHKPGVPHESGSKDDDSHPKRPSHSSSSPMSPVLTRNHTTPIAVHTAPAHEKTAIDESLIVLSCNGKVLHNTVCLGVVKHYFWTQSSDVVIHYRLAEKPNNALSSA